ncbi:MAG: L,D-transpeptidase family protein [Oligoflexia bacterium]|nr:L,D-transpeptidase family protein [Oligoflexia bacterium]
MFKVLTVLLTFAVVSHANEYRNLVPEGFVSLVPGVFSDTAIFVDKSKKKLFLIKYVDNKPQVAAEYDADLGKKPGDKHSTGDNRTPEGIYFFEKQIDTTQLNFEKYGFMAFVTDYPNFFDRLSGKSGYGIWLHAIADTVSLERGSQGCVVVRNETIKKLEPEIRIKHTPILIFNQINWVGLDKASQEKEKLKRTLSEWKSSWQSKNIEQYISFYHPDFKFGKMNLKKNKEYKTELAQKYSEISIKLTEPQVLEHNGNIVAKFYQDYSSPEHADFGEKILYLKKVADGFKIIGEFWEQAPDLSKKTAAIY